MSGQTWIKKANICSPCAATHPGVSRIGAGATFAYAGRKKKSKKKKKKILPLLLYHRSVALVNRFLKNIFIKFSVSSLDF